MQTVEHLPLKLTINNLFHPVSSLFHRLGSQNFNAVGEFEAKSSWFVFFIILHFLDTCQWKTTFYLHLHV